MPGATWFGSTSPKKGLAYRAHGYPYKPNQRRFPVWGATTLSSVFLPGCSIAAGKVSAVIPELSTPATSAHIFAVLLAPALVLSIFTGTPVLFAPIVLNFVVWTPLGFPLTEVAVVKGLRERIASARAA